MVDVVVTPLSEAAEAISADSPTLEAVAVYRAACLARTAAEQAINDHEAASRDLLVALEQATAAHHEAREQLEKVLGS